MATPVLVDVQWLATRLTDPAVRVLDVRWAPSGVPGRQKYDAGHVPGAAFVDLEHDLSHGQPRGPGGRHPMVSAQELAAVLARLGVREDTHVVAYDDGNGSIAARLWWQLRLHGHERVSILDGGAWAWTEAGQPLSKDEPRIAPVPPRALQRDDSRLWSRGRVEQHVQSRGQGALLLDARAPERYRGETEPLDPRAGHIPFAVNAPFATLLRGPEDPRFLPVPALRARLDALGALSAPEVAASCGSGVTACHLLAALELAGRSDARLYAGSYSDWVSDPGAPVATGANPG